MTIWLLASCALVNRILANDSLQLAEDIHSFGVR